MSPTYEVKQRVSLSEVPSTDNTPDYYNRVRYIRDSCKVLSDVWKSDKDYLNKSIDSEISKAFKEFRQGEVARNYRSPYGPNGAPSVLNRTIDDLIQIHEFIDSRRKESLDQIKKIIEQARDKQANIRQTMTELKENYEKSQRKLETADSNLKKFQTRSDRLTLSNFDERSNELEDIRTECEQARTLAHDTYATETYKIANEEHYLTQNIFSQYLFEQNNYYSQISKYLSLRIPIIEQRLEEDELTPPFKCDLVKHCSKRYDTLLAYPIEICIQLLKNSVNEEGLFRIAAANGKQKKLVAELDLQSIDRATSLNELGYDPHVPANTLKQYLRELPDCLLTSALFPQWNEIPQLSEPARVPRIGQLINQLPKINYENLRYLVRFLARVTQYQSENRMTPENLGICVGCSILYPKDQSSNPYASASTILELMIIHHKQFFPNSSQQDQSVKPIKSQPDLIPTEFHSKSRSGSNENLLDSQSLSGFPHPSPSTRRKNKAPPPPPSSLSQPIQTEQTSPDQTSTPYLTGNRIKLKKETKTLTSKSAEESSPSSNQVNNLRKIFTRVPSSSSFTPSDRGHVRTLSDGIQLDRPGAPPPLPPPVVVVASPIIRSKDRTSISLPATINNNNNNEYEGNISSVEEKSIESDSSTDQVNPAPPPPPPPVTDGVKVGKLISELNNRMAAAKLNNAQPNTIRASSIRNSTLSTPGETTDF
ncbi:unnamed protein product [Adineta steineri]|uniref:Rho-GAP domain-containing protein n=1 Tax=Adineta steineri TaxID=433720 RepID=A0A815BUV2_9BILA|nr:unnamed protein product [Adineta steineri]